MNKMEQSLKKLFEKSRIIFWYDKKKELKKEFEDLFLEDVEKLEIDNNEFWLKHHILREKPDQKFLLYRSGAEPVKEENWLLDIQLSNDLFRTDQVALILIDLGEDLDPDFGSVVEDHIDFFGNKKRVEVLKKLLKKKESRQSFRMKILSAAVGSVEPGTYGILDELLDELALGRSEKYNDIVTFNLSGFFWKQVQLQFGYEKESPTVKDLAIDLFKNAYLQSLMLDSTLSEDSLIYIRRWRERSRSRKAFEDLSDEFAKLFSVEDDIAKRMYEDLMDSDIYELIEKKIISDLVQNIMQKTISATSVDSIVKQRRSSHWFEKYNYLYSALYHSVMCLELIENIEISFSSLDDGIRKYIETFWEIDHHYRKFIFFSQNSRQASLMNDLVEKVENYYSNRYLIGLNDKWQYLVDGTDSWSFGKFSMQGKFYSKYVEKYKKVAVIITDGMRFEVGRELQKIILQEDRYDAELESLITMLPSYTQLGMAALLPNNELEIKEGDSLPVYVDGLSSQGTENRSKILKKHTGNKATAIISEEFMKLHVDDSREIIKQNNIVYLYHNRIDKAGSDKTSEERVFDAVEETFRDLVLLIKKLANANVNNILITTDHGFIYQHRKIEESDFADCSGISGDICKTDRRFIVGRDLNQTSSTKKFATESIGLKGSLEVLIPKSINRFRLSGSGSRFVHGGASLQEIIVPVLIINKKRKTDIVKVDIDILRGDTSIISTNQFTVRFYQRDAVAEKMQERKLKAGVYSSDGKLLSDVHEIIFDAESDNAREREKSIRFLLSKEAGAYNGTEIILKLEELEEGSSYYKLYKSSTYLLKKSFTSDFDF